MIESGEVVRASETECEIQFTRSAMCESCGGCHRFGDQGMLLKMENTFGASEGDRADVELSAGSILRASIWAYLFPLAMLALGIYIGHVLSAPLSVTGEWLSAVCGLMGIGISFFVLRRLNGYFDKKQEFSPKLVRIHRKEDE